MTPDTLLLATFCKARDVKDTIDLIATELAVKSLCCKMSRIDTRKF